jgi:serine/threonine protein kinase
MQEQPVQPAPTPPDPDDPLIGTIIGDRYRVEAELGSGGMGTVYRAEHVMMEKRVALKVLHPSLAVVGSVMDRFQREAVALSRIEHPNVVAATDFGKLKNGSYYLALEYVDGRNLAETLQTEGLFDVRRALHIAYQIAEALHAAHARGIVHRDLKPHNVMLTGQPGAETVKVLDFGLAKLRSKNIEGSTANIGAVFGTPHYMAPEQVASTNVDARADLYSLGIMMFEMLTGRRPFDADSPNLVLDLQMSQPPPPLPDHLPDSVRHLVSLLMQKLPEARPESAQVVAQLIHGILHPSVVDEAPSGDLPTWLAHEVNVGNLRLPRWALVLPGVVFLGIVVLGLFVSRDPATATVPNALGEAPTPDLDPTVAATPLPEPDRLPQLISQAEFGDTSALSELRKIAPTKRTRDVWIVLGQGLVKAGDLSEAVIEMKEGVRHQPELIKDERLTAVVRDIGSSDNSKAALEALTFAATELGSRGVDILFSVWSETKNRTPATALAERYLSDDSVLKNASKAVHLALELRKTDETDCEANKRLLEQTKEYGDTRSLRPLAKYRKLRGCGPKKRSDCYPCLRGSELLDEAIREANSRIAPRY